MAEALGVSVEDLLIGATGKTASRKAAKSNGRPAGKVREVFDRVSKLPRRQRISSIGSLPTSLTTSSTGKAEPERANSAYYGEVFAEEPSGFSSSSLICFLISES